VEAIWWRLKAWGGWVATAIAVILAYVHGFALIDNYIESEDRLHVAANVYLATLFFAVIVIAAIRQWMTVRKERYANITPLMHQIIHQIRDLNTFIHLGEPEGKSKEDYQHFINQSKIIFGRVLDQLNTIFTSITSTHCRTSIKLTYLKDGRLYVYTLARDQGSKQKCLRMDNDRVNKNHDPLDENLQFAKLFDDTVEVWHYCCNDLTRDENFRATSVSAYDPEYARRAPAAESRWRLPKRARWPLPYRSTIACVIRQGPFDAYQNIKTEVLGFLTVDSESRNVFAPRWDVEIMFAVADALYAPTRAYLDAQNRSPP